MNFVWKVVQNLFQKITIKKHRIIVSVYGKSAAVTTSSFTESNVCKKMSIKETSLCWMRNNYIISYSMYSNESEPTASRVCSNKDSQWIARLCESQSSSVDPIISFIFFHQCHTWRQNVIFMRRRKKCLLRFGCGEILQYFRWWNMESDFLRENNKVNMDEIKSRA